MGHSQSSVPHLIGYYQEISVVTLLFGAVTRLLAQHRTGESRLRITLLLAIVFLCVAPASLRAQGFGRMTGTVSDASGAVIPSAVVTATQVGTDRGHTGQSQRRGRVRLPVVAAGYL